MQLHLLSRLKYSPGIFATDTFILASRPEPAPEPFEVKFDRRFEEEEVDDEEEELNALLMSNLLLLLGFGLVIKAGAGAAGGARFLLETFVNNDEC